MSSVIKYEDYLKNTYPNEKKILVTIFSQPFPLNAGENPTLTKSFHQDMYGIRSDIDAQHLKRTFKEVFPDAAVVRLKNQPKKQEVLDYIKALGNPKASEFDTFFFVFLTYVSFENTQPGSTFYRDERIHLYDTLCPMEEIYDELKKVDGMQMKPKIFLIQADDVSLLFPIQYIKGEEIIHVKPLKIPQDADRLIMTSDIPQRLANPDLKAEKKNPSFMIEAFCQTLSENSRSDPQEKQDLLSLTTAVNAKVRARINKMKVENERAKDMNVPLVTTTLTKLVKI